MTVDAIRKATPHVVLVAIVLAAGASAMIFINVGLLDYASDSVGNLSAPTAAATTEKPNPRAEVRKEARHVDKRTGEARKRRKQVPTTPVVVTASGSTSVARTAPRIAQPAPPTTAKSSSGGSTSSSKPATTTTRSRNTVTTTPWSSHRSRELEREHEDD